MVDSLYTITGGRLNKPENTEALVLPFPASANNTNPQVFKSSTTTGNIDEFTPSSKKTQAPKPINNTQTSKSIKPRYGARTGVVEKIDDAKERSYTIQSEETLYGIVAREYNLSDMIEIKKKAEEVAARNKLLNKDWIKAGDSLILDKIDDKKVVDNAGKTVEPRDEAQKPVNSTPVEEPKPDTSTQDASKLAESEQPKAERLSRREKRKLKRARAKEAMASKQIKSEESAKVEKTVKAEKTDSNAADEETADEEGSFFDILENLFEEFSIDHAYGNTFINFRLNRELFNE